MSQDTVLRETPLAPDAYRLANESTILQVYTEFFAPSMPEITGVTNENVIDCQYLDFGDVKMGIGDALLLDAPVSLPELSRNNGRGKQSFFRIESIPCVSISNQMQQLSHTSNLKPGRGSVGGWRFLSRVQPAEAAPQKRTCGRRISAFASCISFWS